MKKLRTILLILISVSFLNAQEHHENHEVFGENKLDPHVDLFPFSDKEAAILNEKENSPWFQSLNGLWKFNWVKNPQNKPQNFHKESFDDTNWEHFPVPANWEVHGLDYPIYLDEKYPFTTTWPSVSNEYNPCLLYTSPSPRDS